MDARDSPLQSLVPSVTVRRYQADAARSRRDFVVHAPSLGRLARALEEVLRSAQAERGTGVWSSADPEVWTDETFVGRLARGGNLEQLVGRTIAVVAFPLEAAADWSRGGGAGGERSS